MIYKITHKGYKQITIRVSNKSRYILFDFSSRNKYDYVFKCIDLLKKKISYLVFSKTIGGAI